MKSQSGFVSGNVSVWPGVVRVMTEKPTRWPRDWVWIALLGFGMLIGGCLAWIVAATRVVLPYDEAFVGLSRAELEAVNGRLLAFLAHDRVTLSGTMIAIGVLYAQLAIFPLRGGERWARRAIMISASVGFASFFLFLGFGYFDPLHALVTVLLLPFFLLGLFGPRARPRPAVTPGLPTPGPLVGATAVRRGRGRAAARRRLAGRRSA